MEHEPERDAFPVESWNQAACFGEATETFYAYANTRGKKKKEELRAKAKEICGRCVIRTACLTWALDTREPHGIWGGLDEEERAALLEEKKE